MIVGLPDRALIGVMMFTFARVSAACGMNVADLFHQQRQLWVRLHECPPITRWRPTSPNTLSVFNLRTAEGSPSSRPSNVALMASAAAILAVHLLPSASRAGALLGHPQRQGSMRERQLR